MFSKEESRKLREEFWISFGKSFPTKWTLYRTKIKGLSFKFHFDLKEAVVSLDVDTNLEQRMLLWEKLISLKSIITQDFLCNAKFEDSYLINEQKEISRVFVAMKNVSIHNKNTWRDTMEFLNNTMVQFENFFQEYKDILEE